MRLIIDSEQALDLKNIQGEDGYWYLGSPYTLYPEGHDAAFEHVSEMAGQLMRDHDIRIFAPISHCHPIAVCAGIEKADGKFWQRQLVPFLYAARGLIVAKMDTWEISQGLDIELRFFDGRNLPIRWLEVER